jgi:hypothetical protein
MQVSAERHQHHQGVTGIAERMRNARRYGQSPHFTRRHLEIPYLPRFLQADQARPHHTGGFDGRPMHMVAAHLVRLSNYDVYVFLTREFSVSQRLEQTAARVAMGLDGLYDDPACIGYIHGREYIAAVSLSAKRPARVSMAPRELGLARAITALRGQSSFCYRGGRPLYRRPASSTPTTNIVSHQSKPPPPPLLGAVTVSEAEPADELPPAGAVESALAATALV